jgi:hypothetical protein
MTHEGANRQGVTSLKLALASNVPGADRNNGGNRFDD